MFIESECLLVSKQDSQFNQGKLKIQSINNPYISALVYPAVKRLNKTNYTTITRGQFRKLTLDLPTVNYRIKFNSVTNIGSFMNKGTLLPSDDRTEQPNNKGPQSNESNSS